MMKKYLMMGASALVMGAMFTACSNDSGISAEDYYKAVYEQKFVEVFGKPSPNQTWGFGPQGSTRATRSGNTSGDYTPWYSTHQYYDANGKLIASANMNHNQWGSTDLQSNPGGGWMVPDPLTDGQKERVRKYFQANDKLSYQDPFYANFFVQQVYTGGTAAPTTGNKEETADANGAKHKGMTLNQLTVGAAGSHINDFNAGTCSASSVLDEEGNVYDDRITLMLNVDDTSCFGYHETSGSNVQTSTNHNDKMALVSAAVIDAWAAANGNPGEAVVDKWNRSFMGFDYELLPESDITLDTYALLSQVPNLNNIPYAWDGQKVMILGAAPESTETSKNDDFDLMPYFANHVSTNNATCSTVDGKIVCTFGQYYGSLTFGQGIQDWTPYSKLVVEFETSTISGTIMNIPFSVGDTKVEVPLNDVKWWGDDQGPVIVSNDGTPSQDGTLTITSVKLIGKTIEGVTVDPADYYNPTYLLGDNDADKIAFYSANKNMYYADIITLTEDQMKTTQDGKTCLDLTQFQQLKANGYHPINTTLTEWGKWQPACDGYYSDWIVTLTKAERIPGVDEQPDEPVEPDDPVEPTKIRVMAEDISVSDASDFDFNDVVFDVEGIFAENSTTTNTVKVQLLAAGGTLPLYIGGKNGESRFEVHGAFGVSTQTMTNTHAQRRADGVNYFAEDGKTASPVTITLNNGSFSVGSFPADVRDNIKVEVVKADGTVVELTAPEGLVASKIGCPTGTPWALERVNMNDAFTGFTNYVKNESPLNWYDYKVKGKYFE